jgi:hypothetical protein
MWFDLAARSDGTAHQHYAIAYRESIASNMTISQLFKARVLAAEWR